MESKVLYQQARDLHLEKDYEGAERIYKQIISEHPSSDEAKASMGHIHYIHKEAMAKNKITQAAAPISVVVTDVQIPFWSMVFFFGLPVSGFYTSNYYTFHHIFRYYIRRRRGDC